MAGLEGSLTRLQASVDQLQGGNKNKPISLGEQANARLKGAGIENNNPIADAGKALVQSVGEDIRSIPHLPAALMHGWNDSTASPEENSLRRRAVANAGMMLVSAGWGKLVTKIGFEGLPILLRGFLSNPVASTAAENALASMAYEGIDKGKNADYLSAALGGGVMGAGIGAIAGRLGRKAATAAEEAISPAVAATTEAVMPPRAGLPPDIADQVTHAMHALSEGHAKIPDVSPAAIAEARRQLLNTTTSLSDQDAPFWWARLAKAAGTAETASQASLAVDTGVKSEVHARKYGLTYALMRASGVDTGNEQEKYRFLSDLLGRNVSSVKNLPEDLMDTAVERMGTALGKRKMKTRLTPSHYRMWRGLFEEEPVKMAPTPAAVPGTARVPVASKKIEMPRPSVGKLYIQGPRNQPTEFYYPDQLHQEFLNLSARKKALVKPEILQQLQGMTGFTNTQDIVNASSEYRDFIRRELQNTGPKSKIVLPTWTEFLEAKGQGLRNGGRAAIAQATTEAVPEQRFLLPKGAAPLTLEQQDALALKQAALRAARKKAIEKGQIGQELPLQQRFALPKGSAPLTIEQQNALSLAQNTRREQVNTLLGISEKESATALRKGQAMPNAARPARGRVSLPEFNFGGFQKGGGFKIIGKGDGSKLWEATGAKTKGRFVTEAVAKGQWKTGQPRVRVQLFATRRPDGQLLLDGISYGHTDPALSVKDKMATPKRLVTAALTDAWARGHGAVSIDPRNPALKEVFDTLEKEGLVVPTPNANEYSLSNKLGIHKAVTITGDVPQDIVKRNATARRQPKLSSKEAQQVQGSRGARQGRRADRLLKGQTGPAEGITPAGSSDTFEGLINSPEGPYWRVLTEYAKQSGRNSPLEVPAPSQTAIKSLVTRLVKNPEKFEEILGNQNQFREMMQRSGYGSEEALRQFRDRNSQRGVLAGKPKRIGGARKVAQDMQGIGETPAPPSRPAPPPDAGGPPPISTARGGVSSLLLHVFKNVPTAEKMQAAANRGATQLMWREFEDAYQAAQRMHTSKTMTPSMAAGVKSQMARAIQKAQELGLLAVSKRLKMIQENAQILKPNKVGS